MQYVQLTAEGQILVEDMFEWHTLYHVLWRMKYTTLALLILFETNEHNTEQHTIVGNNLTHLDELML